MEKVIGSDILTPGTKIKPEITTEDAKQILLKVYGISSVEICELNSYDDRNFLVFADKQIKNPNIQNFCTDGYVLKVLNSFDSCKSEFVEAQTALALYMSEQKFVCPKPLKNVAGNYYSLEEFNQLQNIVRLYEYIPGKIFCDVQPSANLYYQAGIYLGKMDETLKNFHHDGYNEHRTLWQLSSVPKLEEFVYVVNEASRDMVETIIKQFQLRVLDNVDEFTKGMIHGDYNEQNILVGKCGADYKVTGILDFGDTNYSCFLYELAIAMTYMMLTSGEIETGGLFLAGYKMTRLIPDNELKVLKLCCCARLCQSLVLGLYSHLSDSENDYLLTTQKAGWKLLETLYTTTDNEVINLWNSVSDEYLSQSLK
ncbi:unnamed protein product [Diamesa serratosioi]